MYELPPWSGKSIFAQAWELARCVKCMEASFVEALARTFLPRVLERLLGTSCNNLKKWGLLSRMTMVAEGLRRKVSVSSTPLLFRRQLLKRSECRVADSPTATRWHCLLV